MATDAPSLPAGLSLPPGTTFPPGVTFPPGTTLPPEFGFPAGTTIPPGLQNATAEDIIGDLVDSGIESTGFDAAGFGDFDFELVNATPVFLAAPIRTYEKVGATKGFAGIPRFGHTHEFARLAYLAYGDNPSEGEDYILGLLFVGCFLLVFFLIWSVVIIIFKIALEGFLCGDPFVNPHISDPASQKLKEDAEVDGEDYIEDTSWLLRPRRIRITFFICGLLQIIFAILLVTQGVANLQETTDTVQVSTSSLRLLVDEALQVSKSLTQVGDTGSALRSQIILDLDKDNFCPGSPIFAQTQAGQSIVAAGDGAVEMLKQLGDFIGENVDTLEESLADGQKQLDQVDRSIEDMEGNEWLGGLVAFPYLILASLMMVGAVAAQLGTMTECFLCVLNWIVLPLFVFITVLAYLSLGVISIAAAVNADFCGGKDETPDQVLVNLMHYAGFANTDLLFQTVRYYANQCTQVAETDPFQFLRSFDGTILQGRVVVQNLTRSMDEVSLEQLSLGCNRDLRPLHRSLSQMIGVLDALLQASNRAINLLRCERVVPVYTDIVYDATCKYSVSGFAWIFSSLLIVSVMGMVMIMFRSSYQNTVFEKPPEFIEENSTVPFKRRPSRLPKSNQRSQRSDRFNDEE